MILDEIALKTKARLDIITNEKRDDMEKKAFSNNINNDFPFYKALAKPDISYIAEVKKASPSKGLICKDFNPVDIAKEYERIKIDAISVLTEQDFFQGHPNYLSEINKNVMIPTLRKDFIIDKFQIHEAKVINAKAVLLICALLDLSSLSNLYKEATSLGLDVLVEAHSREEIDMALSIDAKIIGINNRDLKTFVVDLNTSKKMRKYIPSNKIMVSESGYSKREDIIKAKEIGVDALLIGESFMKSSSKEELLKTFKG
ncbi:MAG: indole-3-glycerol phosphate synthase TrpC [Pleomorphochaeta sp.]